MSSIICWSLVSLVVFAKISTAIDDLKLHQENLAENHDKLAPLTRFSANRFDQFKLKTKSEEGLSNILDSFKKKFFPESTEPQDLLNLRETKTSSPLTIRTKQGRVRGTRTTSGVRIWTAISYAKPPVGSLRWVPPLEPEKFDDVYDATQESPVCLQPCSEGFCIGYSGNAAQMSEDCLYLNIFAPPTATSASTPLGYPVFVWFHGGAYQIGQGNQQAFNGSVFAANHNVIVVTLNYRLNIFGFLNSGSLSGNFGIMDQIMALNWINKNIAAFGGNPNKITIGGESAGGSSVAEHLVAPTSNGLFQRAILESACLQENCIDVKCSTNEAWSDYYVWSLGCVPGSEDMLSCLQAIDTGLLVYYMYVAYRYNLYPCYARDGSALRKASLHKLLHHGEVNSAVTAILAGTNTNEAESLLSTDLKGYSDYGVYFQFIVSTVSQQNTLYSVAYYPMSDSETVYDAACPIYTDALFHCPLRYGLNGIYEKAKNVKHLFRYQFNYIASHDCFSSVGMSDCAPSSGNVCHSTEQNFVFGQFSCSDASSYNGASVNVTGGIWNPSKSDITIADTMNGAWSNFIHSGNPNNGDYHLATYWTPYGQTRNAYKIGDGVNATFENVPRNGDEKCDVLDNVIGYRGVVSSVSYV